MVLPTRTFVLPSSICRNARIQSSERVPCHSRRAVPASIERAMVVHTACSKSSDMPMLNSNSDGSKPSSSHNRLRHSNSDCRQARGHQITMSTVNNCESVIWRNGHAPQSLGWGGLTRDGQTCRWSSAPSPAASCSDPAHSDTAPRTPRAPLHSCLKKGALRANTTTKPMRQ
jgi:hypothetical protein